MCGICGIFDLSGDVIDPVALERMGAVLHHRGPDGKGNLLDREVGLGHRRLSIIDLEGGAQPIASEDGKKNIVFNGEVYNFVELRKELVAHGHVFRTRSDTEVILHAYEQWGKDCVGRLNGMFCFAIWDATERELFVARDHLGIKPLYYATVANRVIFASEIKALIEIEGCPREPDIDSLAELFTFRYVPSPKTLFKGIYKLPAGHWMRVSRKGIEIERYWKWIPRVRQGWNEADLIEEYRELLVDSVKLQLRSDVPLGLFLSSGIDSGVLLAIMSEHGAGPVQTFTIGFEGGERSSEVEDARLLAKRFGAEHHFQVITPDDYIGYYERYMRDIEEPVGNETAAAFYFVSRIASERVKVALTGQGADEPWAGYDRYLGLKLSKYCRWLPERASDTLGRMVNRMPGRAERLKRGATALCERDVLTQFTKIYSFFNADMKAELYRGELGEDFARSPYRSRYALSGLQNDVSHLDRVAQMLYIDTRANLPDDLLMVGDKTSMASSLESRVPLLDYRLVEFAESLPVELRLKGRTGKYLHKKAVEKWLPKDVVYRKKKGFDNPIEHWMRSKIKGFVDDCLLSSGSEIGAYFNRDYIRKMLELDRTGKQQYRRQIYLLLSLELWHRTFMRRG